MGGARTHYRVLYLALSLLGHDAVLDAATITVTTLADNTIVDGQVTLREAIQAANADTSVDGSAAGSGTDQIVFATGAGVITLGGTQLPTIGDALTITGLGANELSIDANGLSRVFEVDVAVTVELSGLTIANGTTMAGNGGGIINMGTLTVTHCTLSGNATSLHGGGIYNTGTLDVRNSTLSGNSALNGGAIGNENTGSASISESTLVANFTGGIAPFAGGGGAILNRGSLTVTNSTLFGNAAGNGGGIVNTDGGTLTITNSTVSTNQALNDGGGISTSLDSTLTISHSTVTGNRSDTNDDSVGNGGGIRVSSGTVSLDGTIVAGNFNGTGTTAVDIYGTVHSASSFNLIGVDTGLVGISDGTGGNQIGTPGAPLDPMLEILQDNGGSTFTHEPLGGSLAIDTGTFSTSVSTDQRGVTRPQGSEADRGAVEVFVATPLPTDRVLQNVALTSFDVIEACNSISAGPNVQVTASGIVTFRAGNLVGLETGFSVETGGQFAVLIQVPTACFGSFP